jgi:hypothetical protein
MIMTKAFAMTFFLLSVMMFSIGLYKYLMQFDAPVPRPYPALKTAAYSELQRRYGEYLERMPDEDEADTEIVNVTAVDTNDLQCD